MVVNYYHAVLIKLIFLQKNNVNQTFWFNLRCRLCRWPRRNKLCLSNFYIIKVHYRSVISLLLKNSFALQNYFREPYINSQVHQIDIKRVRIKPFSLTRTLLVPLIGLEPIRYHYHRILSPARLPISPQRHLIYLFVDFFAFFW